MPTYIRSCTCGRMYEFPSKGHAPKACPGCKATWGPKPIGRPRSDPAQARVALGVRISAHSLRLLKEESARSGLTFGRILDRIADERMAREAAADPAPPPAPEPDVMHESHIKNLRGLLPNIEHALRNNETVTIGGGIALTAVAAGAPMRAVSKRLFVMPIALPESMRAKARRNIQVPA